jgi:hypothetical protein
VIANVMLCSNGMLVVFDQHGQQLPEYQGRAVQHLDRVLAAASDSTVFEIGDWSNGMVRTSRVALQRFADQWTKA